MKITAGKLEGQAFEPDCSMKFSVLFLAGPVCVYEETSEALVLVGR